jgi:hypothetical protein
MIPETLREVLKHEGVVAIATVGNDGPHMVNTWNSYVIVSDNEKLLIPAGYMNKTEANVAFDDRVLLTAGSVKVRGLQGAGTGFLVRGKASFVTSGPDFEVIKARFHWARATLAVAVESATQTI